MLEGKERCKRAFCASPAPVSLGSLTALFDLQVVGCPIHVVPLRFAYRIMVHARRKSNDRHNRCAFGCVTLAVMMFREHGEGPRGGFANINAVYAHSYVMLVV
jgi:hypothetical protein